MGFMDTLKMFAIQASNRRNQNVFAFNTLQNQMQQDFMIQEQNRLFNEQVLRDQQTHLQIVNDHMNQMAINNMAAMNMGMPPMM